jgi:hypothetical protein
VGGCAEAANSGARFGAAGVAGAAAGVAAASACPGYTVLLCLPIFTFAGGLGGIAAVGLASDTSQPHGDVVRALEQKLAAHAPAGELNERLRLALIEKARPHWKVVPASAQNSMTAQVIALSLRGDDLERVSLVMQVSVVIKSVDAQVWRPAIWSSVGPQVGETLSPASGPATVRGSFFHQGASAGVGAWMDDSGEFLEAALTAACESIAQQIATALAPRPPG